MLDYNIITLENKAFKKCPGVRKHNNYYHIILVAVDDKLCDRFKALSFIFMRTQIAPVFIALSFIGWIVFVAGFGKQNEEYVLQLASIKYIYAALQSICIFAK